MADSSALGHRIRRYRPSIHLSHALPYLGCIPSVLVVLALWTALAGRGGQITLYLATAALYLGFTGLVCASQWTAYLDLHERGVVVGRTVLGRRRPIRYAEIHPATLRVFTGIDAVRGGLHAPIWANWHMTGGADLAVTFLGPRPGKTLTPTVRPPAPGNGIVLFGSTDAVQIAEQIRAGLEHAGCPPHLARWSEQFGIEALAGSSADAQGRIPGMNPDWSP